MSEPLPGANEGTDAGGGGEGGAAGATGTPRPSTPPDSREYIILESTQAGTWREKEKVKAADNDAALAAISEPNKEAKYQAIASRNWSPKSPKIETVTTVTFE